MSGENKAIYGKKIFFLYPSRTVQNHIIPALRTKEYEVYTINDYKNARNILMKNPDSIIFINPDSIFNGASWANFIGRIEEDTRIENAVCGLIYEKLTDDQAKQIQLRIKLTAGMVNLKDPDHALSQIVQILDNNQAKGMRQYVRANCMSDSACEIFWMTKASMMYKLKVIDISSVGLAVKVPVKQLTSITLNSIMPNVNLMLKGQKINVTVKVVAVKAEGDHFVAVLMFHSINEKNGTTAIRNYVSDMLYKKIEEGIAGLSPDSNDYNVKETKVKKQDE